MTSEKLKTAVSWTEPDRVLLRGYRMRDLIGRVTFGQAVYLLLVGELPEPKVGSIMQAILVAAIDHGASAPSAKAAITVASCGAPLASAVAAGTIAVTQYHGGAIEDCMKVLEECVAMGLEPFEAATEVVERHRMRGARIAGIGSRIHRDDPRVARLLAYAEEIGVDGVYIEHLHCLQRAVSDSVSKQLPINIDGAIAALLCSIDFPRQAANGLFLISRVAGLVAHTVDEIHRNKPMQSVDAEGLEYNGHPERPL